MLLDGLEVLVTGGTGSFGQAFVDRVLRDGAPKRLVVFSRDELKQHEMAQRFPPSADSPIRYFIGDVRDRDRLSRAFDGIDVVVHAAALKQVPAAEYNPMEAIKTNVLGAANVIDAALDRGVSQVIGLSTDKACSPVNLYGTTKLAQEKLFVAANNYAGAHDTRFSVVRYGNVAGSRGSVIPLWREHAARCAIPDLGHPGWGMPGYVECSGIKITDPRMTRFWITLPQAVEFVLESLERMQGGEVFVPKLPSVHMTDLAQAIAPGCRQEIVGIRPGEKLHESLIGVDEARNAYEYGSYYAIMPPDAMPDHGNLPEGWHYTSNSSPILDGPDLRAALEGV